MANQKNKNLKSKKSSKSTRGCKHDCKTHECATQQTRGVWSTVCGWIEKIAEGVSVFFQKLWIGK